MRIHILIMIRPSSFFEVRFSQGLLVICWAGSQPRVQWVGGGLEGEAGSLGLKWWRPENAAWFGRGDTSTDGADLGKSWGQMDVESPSGKVIPSRPCLTQPCRAWPGIPTSQRTDVPHREELDCSRQRGEAMSGWSWEALSYSASCCFPGSCGRAALLGLGWALPANSNDTGMERELLWCASSRRQWKQFVSFCFWQVIAYCVTKPDFIKSLDNSLSGFHGNQYFTTFLQV